MVMVKVGYTGCVIGIPNPTSDTNLTFTHPTIPPSAHPHAIGRIRYNEVLHNGREVGDVDPPWCTWLEKDRKFPYMLVEKVFEFLMWWDVF